MVRGRSRVPRRWPKQHGCKSGERDDGQNRDRGLGSPRWEHELEHRNWIAKAALEGAERTISAAHHQSQAFTDEKSHERGEPAAALALDGGKPDVAEAHQIDGAECRVCDSKGLGG